MRSEIKKAFKATIQNSTDWANDVLKGTRTHWIRTTTFAVDHKIRLLCKSASYPPIEAVFDPTLRLRLAGAAMALEFNSVKFWMPAKDSCPDRLKCQGLSEWAAETLAGLQSLEGASPEDERTCLCSTMDRTLIWAARCVDCKIERLKTFKALVDSYSTNAEVRYSGLAL
jgi:hypothetical protein